MATRRAVFSGWRRLVWLGGLLCLGGLLSACGSVGGFTGTRSLDNCADNYPVCNTAAGCVLDDAQYIQGVLPGQLRFIFRTPGPAVVQVLLLFTQELSPGTTTEIEWNELGCSSQQIYSTMGQDIFQIAGNQQEITAQKSLQTEGDHLITLTSDATAQYELRAQIVQ